MSLIILAAPRYLVSPVLLICAWAQWFRQPKSRTVASTFSLVGIVLATTSAALAIAAVVYAQTHRFPAFRTRRSQECIEWGWGFPGSSRFWSWRNLAAGFITLVCAGVFRPATLAFWMLAAASEG